MPVLAHGSITLLRLRRVVAVAAMAAITAVPTTWLALVIGQTLVPPYSDGGRLSAIEVLRYALASPLVATPSAVVGEWLFLRRRSIWGVASCEWLGAFLGAVLGAVLGFVVGALVVGPLGLLVAAGICWARAQSGQCDKDAADDSGQ